MSQIQVRDIQNRPIPLLNVRLGANGEQMDGAYDDKFTDFDGNTAWPNPLPSPSYSLFLNYRHVNNEFVNKTINNITNLNPDENIVIQLERNALEKLRVEGFYLNKFIKGHTDFLLYKKYLDGEDINPLLLERSNLGSNCARVIGMVSSFAHWYPQEYGDRYYDYIPRFLALLNDYGMYCYYTVFADTQIVMPSSQLQLQHWERMIDALSMGTNSFVELVNEPYTHSNNVFDRSRFFKPASMVSTAGSFNDMYGDEPHPDPIWDLSDFHTPRGYFKNVGDCCVVSHPIRRKRNIGIFIGEPDKFGHDIHNGQTYNTDPRIAKEMAGASVGTAAGIIYHTSSGIYSEPFDDISLECGRAWFNSLRGI